jgi:hypothetical protein
MLGMRPIGGKHDLRYSRSQSHPFCAERESALRNHHCSGTRGCGMSAHPKLTRGPITVVELDWSEDRYAQTPVQAHQKYVSISQLADRWRCSRGSVYNRLRAAHADVLDFAPRGKRSRKAVALDVVLSIEARYTKRLW